MKFSAALALSIAPLALAKAVHNVYPVARDRGALSARKANNDDNKKNNNNNNNKGSSNEVSVDASDLLALQQLGATQLLLEEVILLWVNRGGDSVTTIVNAQSTVTVTQTVTAGAAEAAATGATQTIVSGASGTVAATGQTHQVTVGGSSLVFNPASISAAVGDMVIFTFLSANHTATQSAFATPCEALAGGMDSGFQANVNNSVNPPPQVAMQVQVATPLWFYCRQKGHCGKGMTFSINPTADKTQAMFQAMAISQNGTGTGSAITGNGGSSSAAAGAGTTATESLTATLGSTATSTAAVAVGTGITSGTGTIGTDGACFCAVECAVGSFPNAAQGINAFGGAAGQLPASMAVAA